MTTAEPDRRRRSYVAGRWVERRRRRSRSRTRQTSRTSPTSPSPRSRRSSGRSSRPVEPSTPASGPTCPPTSGPAVLHASLDHIEAERRRRWSPRWWPRPGQPRRFAEITQLHSGLALGPHDRSSSTCSMPHEEPNPVPVDELVTGRVALSIRRHEPVGVVTAITPYNAALLMAFQKLVPALMAGNSVILRPSPLTPLSSLVFGAAADAAGHPARRVEHRRRGGRRGRGAAHHAPRRRHGLVHRLHGGRPPDPRPGRADGEAGRRWSSAASRRRSTSRRGRPRRHRAPWSSWP